MSADWRVSLKLSLFVATIGAISFPQHAAAQRLSRAAAELVAQANAAEARFKSAQDADQQDAAIVEMEKIMANCGRTRGCPMEQLMPVYRRMLQPDVAGPVDDEGDEDENPINIAG